MARDSGPTFSRPFFNFLFFFSFLIWDLGFPISKPTLFNEWKQLVEATRCWHYKMTEISLTKNPVLKNQWNKEYNVRGKLVIWPWENSWDLAGTRTGLDRPRRFPRQVRGPPIPVGSVGLIIIAKPLRRRCPTRAPRSNGDDGGRIPNVPRESKCGPDPETGSQSLEVDTGPAISDVL